MTAFHVHVTLLAVLHAGLAQAGPDAWLPDALEVSAEVRGHLAPVAQASYPREALDALFKDLRLKGDAFCRRKFNKVDSPEAAAYVPAASLAADLAVSHMGRRAMVLGCRNFFEMNDIRPERGLALVRALSKAGPAPAAFDCYAVGLMQPWMMHRELGCRRLGMVDLDWRILEAHHRLAGLLSAGKLSSVEALEAALPSLDFRWVAQRKHDVDGHSLGVAAPVLCRSQNADCKRTLVELQQRPPPARVELRLTGLEDLDLGPAEQGVRRVLFLSNALEYMSWTGTRGLLDRLAKALPRGEHALLVHHAGGTTGFGLYRLEATAAGAPRIRTLCKDEYPDVRPNATTT
ncbi:MAG: hypothetical protein RL653_2502, partial [Pseudomonadota bacterium]